MTYKPGTSSFLADPKTSLLVFLLSAGAFLFYFIEKFILVDVYKFALVGAIYEFLWLPMWLVLLLAPVCSIFILINRHSKKWLALGSILLIGVTMLMISR